jgi:hypothetical protein
VVTSIVVGLLCKVLEAGGEGKQTVLVHVCAQGGDRRGEGEEPHLFWCVLFAASSMRGFGALMGPPSIFVQELSQVSTSIPRW